MNDTVTISKTEYDALYRAQMKLGALEAHGVDNWEGWDDAMASFHEALSEEGIE